MAEDKTEENIVVLPESGNIIARRKYSPSKCIHNRRKDTCIPCHGNSVCIHNKVKRICKDCKGASLCIHLRRKNMCTICKGTSVCIHKRLRNLCKECGGRSVCSHGRIRATCITCKGGSVCPHNKQRFTCKDCNGGAYCIHKRIKYNCKICNPDSVCIHHRTRAKCKDCNPTILCPHEKRKARCKICKGSSVCIHNREKGVCKDCNGSLICSHGHLKYECMTCTPKNACIVCHTINASRSKWKPYCFRCFCITHPDVIIPKRYRLKEHYIVEYLKQEFEEKITMRFDKQIEGGCSRHRPDVAIDFGSHCLMIEIDEHQHASYSCEEKRMVNLYEDIGFRKIVFIRFNPDKYTHNNKAFRSPFNYTKTGIVKILKREFNRRMKLLIKRIYTYQNTEPVEQLTVEYLFYNM
jgi:hypothetical protein